MNTRIGGHVPLSERTLGFLIQGWRAGKAALTILLIGAICILAAFSLALANRQLPAFVFLGVGALLISVVIYHFYYEAIVPARQASVKIKENAEILDVVQNATLELTAIITDLNDFSLMHANVIVATIVESKRLIANVPFVNNLLKPEYFEKPEQFALKVRRIAAASRQVIDDVGDSVRKADLQRIRSHVKALKELKQMIESELALAP